MLYIQDKAGDENYLLYQVDIASGEERTLTPFENTRVRVFGGSHTIRDKLLVGLNNRDPRFHDVYMLNLDDRRARAGAAERFATSASWPTTR